MPDVLDIARYIVELANQEQEPDGVSNKQLQKILYYAQGWHFGLFGKPLFAGQFEAWKDGPVSPKVYAAAKRALDGYPSYFPISTDRFGSPANIGEKEKAFVRSIWNEYKKYTATGLGDMTHKETPWIEARKGLPANAVSSAPISELVMEHFFSHQPEAKDASPEALSLVLEGEADLVAGRVRSIEEVRKARLAR